VETGVVKRGQGGKQEAAAIASVPGKSSEGGGLKRPNYVTFHRRVKKIEKRNGKSDDGGKRGPRSLSRERNFNLFLQLPRQRSE